MQSEASDSDGVDSVCAEIPPVKRTKVYPHTIDRLDEKGEEVSVGGHAAEALGVIRSLGVELKDGVSDDVLERLAQAASLCRIAQMRMIAMREEYEATVVGLNSRIATLRAEQSANRVQFEERLRVLSNNQDLSGIVRHAYNASVALTHTNASLCAANPVGRPLSKAHESSSKGRKKAESRGELARIPKERAIVTR